MQGLTLTLNSKSEITTFKRIGWCLLVLQPLALFRCLLHCLRTLSTQTIPVALRSCGCYPGLVLHYASVWCVLLSFLHLVHHDGEYQTPLSVNQHFPFLVRKIRKSKIIISFLKSNRQRNKGGPGGGAWVVQCLAHTRMAFGAVLPKHPLEPVGTSRPTHSSNAFTPTPLHRSMRCSTHARLLPTTTYPSSTTHVTKDTLAPCAGVSFLMQA